MMKENGKKILQELIYELTKRKAYSFYVHNIFLTLFLMVLWGVTSYCFISESWEKIRWWMLVGVIIFVAFALFITFCHYRRSRKRDSAFDRSKILPKWPHIYKYVLFFASPCWFFADMFKEQFKSCLYSKCELKDKIGLTRLITRLNGCNVFVAVIIVLVTASVSIIKYPWNIDISHWGFGLFTTFVMARTLSRSFEITYAFGKDASEGRSKDSRLQPHERLLLAITSLIECILNYSVAYYLVSFYSVKKLDLWYSFVCSFQSGLFYSNSFLDNCPRLSSQSTLSMLQLTQVVTCMTLVFLAFAIYISGSTGGKSNASAKKS
ncbi:MAG: resistance to Congo red protein [Candidatus Cloacimonetes bacterium]|nr:resistance to Congo red protein [Candidatus Cloacimonadota bacterium]